MQQTAVISQEQSDLVTSATMSAGGPKDSIKNGKTVIIASNPTNINKAKITTNINNNNSTTTNKNNSANKTAPNGRADVIVTNLQHKINSAVKSATAGQAANQAASDASGKTTLPDARAVLKEAVDAVVNSFTKHTQGYGRGEFTNLNINLYFHRPGSG